MPLRATVNGTEVRTDHLTLGQLLALEQRAGKKFNALNPFTSARDALALATVLAESAGRDSADALALSADVSRWLAPVDDDLPEMFRDGVPAGGGRSFDEYVVVFGMEPWCWPPDVTRRQKVRDLDLLLAAMPKKRGHRR